MNRTATTRAGLVGRVGLHGVVAAACVAAAAPLSGCAEPAFSAHLPDNNVADIRRALLVEHNDARAKGPAAAYLVTAGDKHLVAFELTAADDAAGKARWDVPANVTSRLAVGRGFVAHRQGASEIAVRSSQTGALRCTIALKPGAEFVGLAADTRVYWVTQSTSGKERVSTIAAASPDCSPLWHDDAQMSIGAPAAQGDLVAAPYAYQNVVLLDGASGAEISRVRATDETVSFVRATPEGLFYGDNKGVYALDEKSAAGSKKGSSYVEAHLASSQIRTFFYWDAYQPSQADYTAFDRNRLLWRADDDNGVARFRDDQAILHSYRYLFAFDAKTGAIRWAYAHPRVDLVASDDTGPAVVYAATDGELGALDAKTGAPTWSVKTGLKVAGATFAADGFAPAAAAAEAPPLTKTLADIVTDPDSRFTAVKVFAIASMVKLAAPEITGLLVKIVTRPGVAPAVAKAAAEALLARHDAAAAPAYREALAVRTDYLNDTQPRGVDVLAQVEADIDDHAVAPLLAAHLLDPSTPLSALARIVDALTRLGGPEALAALRDFALSYRADPGMNVDLEPIEKAVGGLLARGGAEGRRVALFVAEEKRTLPPLALFARQALDEATKAASTKTSSAEPVGGASSGRADARSAGPGGAPATGPAATGVAGR